jgi:predicted kinase
MPSELPSSSGYMPPIANVGGNSEVVPVNALGSNVGDLHMMMGLQGSGKSTYRKTILEKTLRDYAVVSKDLMPDGKKEDRQRAMLDEAFRAGKSVILDNTNVSREVRADAIQRAKKWGARVFLYFMDVDIKTCKERNAGRSGKACVPEHVIDNFNKRLEKPSYDEGFDHINIIEPLGKSAFSSTRMQNEKPHGALN